MESASFGQWMRERRRALRLTQLELADQVGASLETIQKLETGKRRPSRQMAELLAARLGLADGERSTFVELARAAEEARGTEVLRQSNLPRQMTSLVGREREIVELQALVESRQLVTLTGPGGAGKTRLAVAVAQELQTGFKDGVIFVDLGPLSEPQQVALAVAESLGLQDRPGRGPVEAIQGYFRTLRALLLLDNCEHLLEACSSLVDACLRACPQLHVLATSRQPLSLHYEVAWSVPPLALPERYPSGSVESLSAYSAIELFVQRARRHLPGFALTESNGKSIVEVCKRLDGLPLAIELAAARVNVLSVQQIAARLDGRLRLLAASNAHSIPARQRTLSMTLDWSYQLLTAAEQRLLRRLSVFADAFELDAVQAVCGEDHEEFETIDLVAGLVNKSLVVRSDVDGKAWYRLLETIKEYAREKLQENGEAASVRNRHVNLFLHLAEEAAPKLKGREQLESLARLERERDNLQAALAWSLTEPGAPEAGLRLATALGWFWQMRGHLMEGLAWFDRLLALPENLAHTTLRCEALFQAGALAWKQHSLEAAKLLMGESFEIANEINDRDAIARATTGMAMVADFIGDVETARSHLSRAIEIFAEMGRLWDVGWCLLGLVSASVGINDPSSVSIQAEENVELFRELGDAWAGAIALTYWGMTLYRQGQYESCRDKLEQALAINEKFGDRGRTAWATQWLARCALAQQDYAAATDLYGRLLTSYQMLGDKWYALSGVCGIANIAEVRGDLRSAATLFAAVAALDPNRYPQAYLRDGARGGPAEAPLGASGRQAAPPNEMSPVEIARSRANSIDELVDYSLRIASSPAMVDG